MVKRRSKKDPHPDSVAALLLETGQELRALWPGAGTGRELTVKRKEDGTAVTEADLLSHEIISKRLAVMFPKDFLLSEEAVDSTGYAKAKTAWILDPLDCTEAYIRGEDHFSIFLSRREGNEITEAYIYYPALEEIIIARRGKGAFLNGVKLAVAPSLALRPQSLYTEALPLAPAPHLCGQGKFAVGSRAIVAFCRGEIDGALIRQTSGRLFVWDWAPLDLIVRESGGVMSTGKGAPLDLSHHPVACAIVVVSTPALHTEVLQLIPA